jgi:hypothetical protein
MAESIRQDPLVGWNCVFTRPTGSDLVSLPWDDTKTAFLQKLVIYVSLEYSTIGTNPSRVFTYIASPIYEQNMSLNERYHLGEFARQSDLSSVKLLHIYS